MTGPRIVVRYFGPGPKAQWFRLASVLAHTARRHCPRWQHDIQSVEPAEPELYSQRGVQGHVWNTHKLDVWTRVVQEAEDGEQLLLLDADTIITRSLDDVWALPFDVAYTVKPNSETRRFPLNGGVVFLRVSDRARAFMAGWQAQNRAFLDDDKEYAVWSGAYGGINQAALGVYLRSRPALDIRKLPCLEWNCEDEHWAQFDPEVTRILHVKSHLRDAILKMVKPEDEVRPLVRLWRQLEEESAGHPVVSVPLGDVALGLDRFDEGTAAQVDALTIGSDTSAAPTTRGKNRKQRRKVQHDQAQRPAEQHGAPGRTDRSAGSNG